MLSNFKHIKNIGNFGMIKCKHLLFNIKNIFKNSSNYITIILIFLNLTAIISFCFFNVVDLEKTINDIWKKKKKETNNINQNKNDNNINKTKRKKTLFDTQNNTSLNRNRTQILIPVQKNFKNVGTNNKNLISKIKRNQNIKRKNQIKEISKSNRNNSVNNSKKALNLKIKNKELDTTEGKIKSKNKEETISDAEMKFMDYNEAKKNDKRTFLEYYSSLLKTKHILIFSFCFVKDYNSQAIKINIFFFTFVINYLISTMFYSDITIHKIYVDEGAFDFTYQLPKMFYSFLISIVLKSILNVLGLYEDDVISFKRDKNLNIKSKEKVLFKIRCKIICFFILNFIFLFFFWIYLGCFCAVYKNTQIHLLLEVVSSFCFSFITPIFIYLLPSMFRIPSLKRKANRHLMFKFSKFLEIL